MHKLFACVLFCMFALSENSSATTYPCNDTTTVPTDPWSPVSGTGSSYAKALSDLQKNSDEYFKNDGCGPCPPSGGCDMSTDPRAHGETLTFDPPNTTVWPGKYPGSNGPPYAPKIDVKCTIC